ncbi:tyrosine-type recombinase/integrase [Gloeocapsa sp. PCC 7428]|uniref:tyrosine-type recombinase/integrase n=1 Tax=Gloeocapsa sp. PCC 7428 TaxID=1173026 RepID=UPI00351020DF
MKYSKSFLIYTGCTSWWVNCSCVCGLRLSEGLQLRVKDIDFAQQQLVIRDTKGKENRVTMLPNV